MSLNGAVNRIVEGMDFVTGMGVSADGDLYYADTNLGVVRKRAPNGDISDVVTGLDGPVGIAMCPAGDCFYLNTMRSPGYIYRITFDGAVTEVYSALGGGATDIAVDAAGNLYIAYFNNREIKKLTPGGTLEPLATLDSWVGYITFANGVLYVTAWEKHMVMEVDPFTGDLTQLAGSGTRLTEDGDAIDGGSFNEPNGIAASVTGDTLWVSQNSDRSIRAVTGVRPAGLSVDRTAPESFLLDQNYPNPFNPVTTIPVHLDEAGQIRLTVHNTLGTVVAEVFTGYRPAGEHTFSWDAGSLPSGIYLYRLEASGRSSTRSMTLLK